LSEAIPSHKRLLRLFSSAIADQAVLSAANFMGAVLMLRRVSDADYGLYVLITSALLLVTGMQDALISCPMQVIAAKKESSERLDMSVDLLSRQYVFCLPLVPAALLVFTAVYWQGHSYASTAGILTAGVALLIIAREHLRQMLLLYNKPGLLVTADAVYVVVFLGGIYAATRSRLPVHLTILGVGTAALLSTLTSLKLFRRAVGWGKPGYQGALHEVWRLGKWGLAGCVLTWLHSQGFFYLLAALEGASMVAGVAAVRLLLMPVNLLLAGTGQLLLPMASGWQERNGTHDVVSKMTVIGALIFAAALCYFSLTWALRTWIVANVLHRQVGSLDPLLLMWGAAFVVATLRSFGMVVLQVQERFASLVYLALVSTSSSLILCWWGITHYGAVGSVLGIVLGESVDLFGIIWLILRSQSSTVWSSRSSVLSLNELTKFSD
jgi:O-antigen/teichoic acid export membrane protein